MSALTETRDEQLLRMMQAGDEGAFTTLYRRRQSGIYRFVLEMSGSAPLAEDVTQEVFMALIRDNRGYDPSRGSLGAYLLEWRAIMRCALSSATGRMSRSRKRGTGRGIVRISPLFLPRTHTPR